MSTNVINSLVETLKSRFVVMDAEIAELQKRVLQLESTLKELEEPSRLSKEELLQQE